MKKDNKEKILKFLKNNTGKKFSIRQIHQSLKISYPTAQRAVALLHAEKKIKIDDLGNTKLVYL